MDPLCCWDVAGRWRRDDIRFVPTSVTLARSQQASSVCYVNKWLLLAACGVASDTERLARAASPASGYPLSSAGRRTLARQSPGLVRKFFRSYHGRQRP